MLTRNVALLGIAVSLSFQVSLAAQTYATPELKQKAEAELAAKLQKIQKDPEAYRAQGGIPEQYLKDKPSENPELVTYDAPVDLKRSDLYKLVAIDAVDVDNKHTAQEMKAFQAEAEGEFEKTNIALDWENQRLYFIPRDKHKRPAEKKFQVEKGLIQLPDCRICQNNTFRIAEQSKDTLILHLQPEDGGQFFVFSFTFKKQ